MLTVRSRFPGCHGIKLSKHVVFLGQALLLLNFELHLTHYGFFERVVSVSFGRPCLVICLSPTLLFLGVHAIEEVIDAPRRIVFQVRYWLPVE